MKALISKIEELESYEKVIMGICGSFTLLMVTLILLNILKISFLRIADKEKNSPGRHGRPQGIFFEPEL